MRRLTAVNLVPHLTTGIVHENLALASLHEHNEVCYQTHHQYDKDRSRC